MIAALFAAAALLVAPVTATEVHTAVAEARALGYEVCEPTVVDAAQGYEVFGWGAMSNEVAGWAAWPEAFGACVVGMIPELPEDPEFLGYVARHEVCHLAVGVGIDSDLAAHSMSDRHHQHPLFHECMNRLAGVPVPEGVVVAAASTAPEPVVEEPLSMGLPGGGLTNIEFATTPDPVYTDHLCDGLMEAKPWIEWSCK